METVDHHVLATIFFSIIYSFTQLLFILLSEVDVSKGKIFALIFI